MPKEQLIVITNPGKVLEVGRVFQTLISPGIYPFTGVIGVNAKILVIKNSSIRNVIIYLRVIFFTNSIIDESSLSHKNSFDF